MPSSSALSSCRVEWRPSRWLAIALAALGALALCSLWLSALPGSIELLVSVVVACHATMLIRRELRRPSFVLTWSADEDAAILDFDRRVRTLSEAKLSFRGPLAGLRGKDESGRTGIYLWWPDTISSTGRRRLRLIDQTRKPPQAAPRAI